MSWKEFLNDYLSFNRKERIAILVLISLIILTILAPGLFKQAKSPNLNADTSWMAEIKKLEQSIPDENKTDQKDRFADQYYPPETPNQTLIKTELFYFDPNLISKKEWQKLGIRDKIINTIKNYLAKGGHFYQAVDLKKIYGFNNQDFDRLYPFIRIESNRNNEIERINSKVNSIVSKPDLHNQIIDINLADTTALIALPGIGSKLAARIISFRDKLG